MTFDPLILEPAPESLWIAFHARRLPERPPPILAHWERSRALGADREGPHAEDGLRDACPPACEPTAACGSSLAQLQARAIRIALADADGNISLAAAHLGVARSTLYRMMRRHRLTPSA